MPKIIIDHRERSSGIIRELGRRGIDIEVKQLVVADFVLQTKDREGNIQTIGIEKKTQQDFINSMIDKRILSQLVSLRENFQFPLLIIEGSENIYAMRNIHPNAIRGMLTSIAVDFQIPVLYTTSFRDTAALLEVMAKRLEKTPKPITLVNALKPPTTKELQEYIVSSIPSVGATLAKSLLKKFKTIQAVVNASEEELQEVDKIGPKKAKQIKEILTKNYEG